MGQAPPSDANSLPTFNRNFPGRSGPPEDSVTSTRRNLLAHGIVPLTFSGGDPE